MISIVFENDHAVIAHKPSGTLSVPSRLGPNETRPILKKSLETQLKRPLWSVHRLDFEVSGLIIYAKSAEFHRAANSWFEKQMVTKTYSALTEGDEVDAQSFQNTAEWRSYIVRGKKRSFEAPYGQEAITLARFQRREGDYLRWELQPKTGRSHQLRFELAKHGFPIVGDTLYGAKSKLRDNAIELAAVAIDFSQCPEREKYQIPNSITIAG